MMKRRDFMQWAGLGLLASSLPVALAACQSDSTRCVPIKGVQWPGNRQAISLPAPVTDQSLEPMERLKTDLRKSRWEPLKPRLRRI